MIDMVFYGNSNSQRVTERERERKGNSTLYVCIKCVCLLCGILCMLMLNMYCCTRVYIKEMKQSVSKFIWKLL